MEMLRPLIQITSVLVLLVSTQIISLGSICVEEDGMHIDLSTQHACCSEDACAPVDECNDYSLNLDISNRGYPTKIPDAQLTVLFVLAANITADPDVSSGFQCTKAGNPCMITEPIHTLRIIEILV